MPERLNRLPEVFQERPIYFVTACSHQRQKLLANAEAQACVQHFAAAGPEHGAWLSAYILMPDHLHAFVAFSDADPARLSAWMRLLKNALSRCLRERGAAAPLWQKGFFDHVLRSHESYAEKWLYVWNNPVRAQLVDRAEEWPFAGQPFALRMTDP